MGAMSSILSFPLGKIEHRLRKLLPADLYAEAWVNPSAPTLRRVFEHLRSLQHILYNYTPRQLAESLPIPGELRYEWQVGTLMFTDLAGFTPLMEANAAAGRQGADQLLKLLNTYFATMLEIISKSGGNLLEFTGDALLVQFTSDHLGHDTSQAVRAGLRMQRAMSAFQNIETERGLFSLGMRVGIHTGRFLTAEIGTPQRMEHVLLGTTVQRTKRAEGAGTIGRVCLTPEAWERVKDEFDFEDTKENHLLVIDNLSEEQLGSYEIRVGGRRLSSAVMTDTTLDGLVNSIEDIVNVVEPLACYIPYPILNLLVESAARRHIPPQFAEPTIAFVNLGGIPQSADYALPHEEQALVTAFSRVFALINAAIEARGGVLKKVTYHLYGSDMMIIFGLPNAHVNDSIRAASAALAIRDIITQLTPPIISGQPIEVMFQIGIAKGAVFAAEIGEPRGRREFNILSDAVNTAARLMARADTNSILITEDIYYEIREHFRCENLGAFHLKGKTNLITLYALHDAVEDVFF